MKKIGLGLILGLLLGIVGCYYGIHLPIVTEYSSQIINLDSSLTTLNADKNVIKTNLTEAIINYNLALRQIENLELLISQKNERYESLSSEYSEHIESWDELVSDWDELIISYNELSDWYTELSDNRDLWVESYDDLIIDYNELEENYSSIYHYKNYWESFCNDPVVNQIRPHLVEVYNFLNRDITDSTPYTDSFLCRHFALVLSLKAKSAGFKMGVVSISGVQDNGENVSHAINAIMTKDGLVYIEPQDDYVWWYDDYEAIQLGGVYKISDEWVVTVNEIQINVDY